MNQYIKSVLDMDLTPIVLCDIHHTIVYMNEAAIKRYKGNLVGKSVKDCHNDKSNEIIDQVVAWFQKEKTNNRIFTHHNPRENKDVYMIALRDENQKLIGYYEKHEYRNVETESVYNMGDTHES